MNYLRKFFTTLCKKKGKGPTGDPLCVAGTLSVGSSWCRCEKRFKVCSFTRGRMIRIVRVMIMRQVEIGKYDSSYKGPGALIKDM